MENPKDEELFQRIDETLTESGSGTIQHERQHTLTELASIDEQIEHLIYKRSRLIRKLHLFEEMDDGS